MVLVVLGSGGQTGFELFLGAWYSTNSAIQTYFFVYIHCQHIDDLKNTEKQVALPTRLVGTGTQKVVLVLLGS